MDKFHYHTFQVADEATLTALLLEPESDESQPLHAMTNGYAPRQGRAAKPRVPITPGVEAG